MTFILLDNLDNYFPQIMGTEVIVSPTYKRKLFSWVMGAWDALRLTSTNDTIVCWLDIQAVIIYWLSTLTFRRQRNIIAINILLKNKKGLKNRIATILYRKALKSDRFRATVTSPEYGDYLNLTLGTEIKFTHLPDIFPEEYKKWNPTSGDGTVFCGGNNSRDWPFIISLAKTMPQTVFRLVMPKDKYDIYSRSLPKNVLAKHSLSKEGFLAELSKSTIVALPVNTEAPAGLIVMYQATALGKPIITTSTATTRGYINDSTGIALPNALESWKAAISESLSNQKLMADKAINLHQFLSERCSSNRYASTVASLIKSI